MIPNPQPSAPSGRHKRRNRRRSMLVALLVSLVFALALINVSVTRSNRQGDNVFAEIFGPEGLIVLVVLGIPVACIVAVIMLLLRGNHGA